MRKYLKFASLFMLLTFLASCGTGGWNLLSVEADGDVIVSDLVGRVVEVEDVDRDDFAGFDRSSMWGHAETDVEPTVIVCIINGIWEQRNAKHCPVAPLRAVAAHATLFSPILPRPDKRRTYRRAALSSSTRHVLVRSTVFLC